VKNHNVLYALRQQQHDLTVSIAENLVRQDSADRLTQFLQAAKSNAMIRRYEFATLEGLHEFQLAMTGFQVVYDGTPVSFAIARRRMLVSLHKKWEAQRVRVQVVRHDKAFQLLAFFDDFIQAKCMNFVLKSTDLLENLTKSAKPGIRLVDAKFPLPQGKDEVEQVESQFVCLDTPEYPSEHDDIAITFDSDAGKITIYAFTSETTHL
jgi:hypothetical protein